MTTNPTPEPTKKPYHNPELVEYGSMAELTLTVSGGKGADGGVFPNTYTGSSG
jgi:hypothetical protein